jgi:hypothetical protein
MPGIQVFIDGAEAAPEKVWKTLAGFIERPLLKRTGKSMQLPTGGATASRSRSTSLLMAATVALCAAAVRNRSDCRHFARQAWCGRDG